MRIANIIPTGSEPSDYSPPAALIGADNTFEGVPSGFQVHPSNEVDLMLMGVATVDAAMRAEQAGFDAAVINTVLDYGLKVARSACRMPVVGAGQAGMLAAAGVGRRFSLISIWPESMRPLHEAQLREYAMVDRCASMRFVTAEPEMATVGDEDGFYAQLRSRQRAMIDRIASEIDFAVREDGADSVVLGCTCMSVATRDLQSRTSVPVIDPLAAAYLNAEALVRLGISQSITVSVPPAVRRAATFAAAVEASAASLEMAPDAGQECEVCVLTDDGCREDAGLVKSATAAISG
jgi:allantoin racemase